MGTNVSKTDDIKGFVNKLLPAITETLPKVGATAERFTKVAMLALRKNDKLMACSHPSIAECLILSASLGLEPNTPQQHAYLIPYGKECTFIIGYRGLVELARRSGQISDIYAEVVREGDAFTEIKGLDRQLIHSDITDDESAPILKAYAVAKFKDGTTTYAIISKRDVDKIIKTVKRGQAGNIWKMWPEEMWKKTAIRRLCKLLPASVMDNRVHEILDKETAPLDQIEPTLLSAGTLDYGKNKPEPEEDQRPSGDESASESEPQAPEWPPEEK